MRYEHLKYPVDKIRIGVGPCAAALAESRQRKVAVPGAYRMFHEHACSGVPCKTGRWHWWMSELCCADTTPAEWERRRGMSMDCQP